jgi:hypothetical protein
MHRETFTLKILLHKRKYTQKGSQHFQTSIVAPLHDLVSGRYVIVGLKNEEKSSYQFGVSASKNDFTPSVLRQAGVR